MTSSREYPYGLWPSLLSSEQAARSKLSLSGLASSSDSLYWVEGRPELAGRRVVVAWTPGSSPVVVSPEGLSLASRVHEYGGGEFAISTAADGAVTVFGVRAEDQALIRFSLGDEKEHVVLSGHKGHARGDLSCADGTVVFVEEDLTGEKAKRSVVRVDPVTEDAVELLRGRDFYCHARIHPQGDRLVWCTWDHPAMSWDAAEVWTASLRDGAVSLPQLIAGGAGHAATHPRFLANGDLVFLEEQDGWRRPIRWSLEGGRCTLGTAGREYGGPLWVLGEEPLVECGDTLYAIEHSGGLAALVALDENHARDLEVSAMSLSTLAAVNGSIAWSGSTPTALGAVGLVSPDGAEDLVERGPECPLAPDEVSLGESVSARGPSGEEVYGLLFRPTSRRYHGPEQTPPPVVVVCHGGPTAQARAGFDPMVQLFCSRGFAVLAANYGGSTGFGAAYRHRLDGQWGVVDVTDCVTLVEDLARRGEVDGTRAAIRGGSAGGFTALLAATTGKFRCVVSWYGVADLELLAAATHDFESRYIDSLVGPLPEARELYHERSPVSQVAHMSSAVLLLQGMDDPVVPPEQSEAMAAALRAAGREVTLRCYEGESHGFRRLETLVDAYESELAFYQHHLCGEQR